MIKPPYNSVAVETEIQKDPRIKPDEATSIHRLLRGRQPTEPGRYRTFTRSWWRRNADWPGGREPGAGRPRTHARNLTEADARRMCRDWNATHDPGFLSRKMEYARQ
jgi:hypothetical protein